MYLRLQMCSWLCSFLLLFAVFQVKGGSGFFDQADQFFQKYVKDGKVDYAALHNNPQPLESLTKQLKNFDLSGKSGTFKKAFWINAYNLTVIQSVINRYPLNSPMDVDGFFDKVQHKVAGQQLTLNQIENKKIRATYKDARIHFVLVCAAMGCPQIVPYAYQPDQLDQQLEKRTRQTLNDDYFIRLKNGQQKVLVSEIFKWYKKDFTRTGKSIRGYINQYRDKKIPGNYAVGYYTYDWTLNSTKKNR